MGQIPNAAVLGYPQITQGGQPYHQNSLPLINRHGRRFTAHFTENQKPMANKEAADYQLVAGDISGGDTLPVLPTVSMDLMPVAENKSYADVSV